MANMNIPAEERNLSPAQVAVLDKRRQWGLVYQVIAGQFGVFRCAASALVGAGCDVFAWLGASDVLLQRADGGAGGGVWPVRNVSAPRAGARVLKSRQ